MTYGLISKLNSIMLTPMTKKKRHFFTIALFCQMKKMENNPAISILANSKMISLNSDPLPMR